MYQLLLKNRLNKTLGFGLRIYSDGHNMLRSNSAEFNAPVMATKPICIIEKYNIEKEQKSEADKP
jgi:hypothetical protein